MKYLILIFFVNILVFTACKSKEIKSTSFWVNSKYANCEDKAGNKCLEIQRGDTVIWGNWELLNSEIIGFNYEEGYIYKITVIADENNPQDKENDQSIMKYELIEINQKIKDEKLIFNELWYLDQITKNSITFVMDSIQHKPFISFNLKEKRATGSDGCNNFMTSIISLNFNQLQFGSIAGTKKFCDSMAYSGAFLLVLPMVTEWKIDSSKLVFLNSDGKYLMKFQKQD